jgi:hypothetical protein
LKAKGFSGKSQKMLNSIKIGNQLMKEKEAKPASAQTQNTKNSSDNASIIESSLNKETANNKDESNSKKRKIQQQKESRIITSNDNSEEDKTKKALDKRESNTELVSDNISKSEKLNNFVQKYR